MLSILIPTYNVDILELAKELHHQAQVCQVRFEIRIYEDGSTETFQNSSSIDLENCNYKVLPRNIGRSAIRNLMVQDAQFETLLFVDAGTMPRSPNMIKDYLADTSHDVLCGGMTHSIEIPEPRFLLRWLYTKNREHWDSGNPQNRPIFHSSNFMTSKTIMDKVPFDESLSKYGYEDVLFRNDLEKSGLSIKFFDNPVVHLSDDDNGQFMAKTENALENLHQLVSIGRLDHSASGISRNHQKLRRLQLHGLLAWAFRAFKPMLLKKLNSDRPSLRAFDLYRLGYFANIKTTS